MCMCVYMYHTQLFSAPHLSEALLPRECVRIGWLANAAKGRLGAPYFSWEKSEGCIVWPLLLSRSPCTRHRGTCPSRVSSEGPGTQACKELKASDRFCLIVQSLGGPRRESEEGHIRMVYHLLLPWHLSLWHVFAHKSEQACPQGVLLRITEPH